MGWFRKERDDDRDRRLMFNDFREVFGTPAGKRVLARILADLGFYREVSDQMDTTNDVAVAMQDYARRLLHYLGAWDDGNELRIVDKIMEIVNER